MKKSLPILIILSLYCYISLLYPSSVLAAETGNKFGLNVAARANHVDREIARYLQQDGWIVMMPAAPNYNPETANQVYNEIVGNYFSKLGSQVNYILRAHYPHASNPNFTDHPTFPDASDSQWATKWADFWAGIINRLPIPSGSVFYVMPWNEPNLQRECSGIGDAYNPNDCSCASYVLEYITQLEARLDRSKAKFLTPAFAVSAPNFYSFVGCLGGASFFNRFDGVALDYYDFQTNCDGPFCNPNPMFNPNLYSQLLANIGASGKKLFIVETGLVSPEGCEPGVPDCPNFTQPDITIMLCELYNRHKEDNSFVMFAPLTYNPERAEGNWFWDTSEARDFYLERYEDCSLVERGILLEISPSAVRSAWNDTGEEREEVPYSPSPSPSSVLQASNFRERNTTGRIIFHEVNFPNFTPIAKIFGSALKTLLPKTRSEKVSFPGKTTLKFRTFVVPRIWGGNGWVNDEDNKTPCECAGQEERQGCAAQEDSDVAGEKWGKLVGATKGLLHLLPRNRVLDKLRYLTSFRYRFQGTERTCQDRGFGPGPTVRTADLPKPENIKEKFTVRNIFAFLIRETIETIENLIRRILHYEYAIQIRPNADLEHGNIVPQDSTQVAGGFLPKRKMEEFDPQDEAEALMVSGEDRGIVASVYFSPQEYAGHELLLAKQGRTRNYDCSVICIAHSIKAIEHGKQPLFGKGKICPSCDPKDYQVPASPKPKPPDTHELCQWDGFGCHYYDPNYCQNHPEIENCDECALCEGCLCLPTSLPPPGKFFCDPETDPEHCDTSCIGQCHWEFFEPNPAGGYGPCYYQNPNVCLRNDGVGGCAGICNAACCPGG